MRCGACHARIEAAVAWDFDGPLHHSCFVMRRSEAQVEWKDKQRFILASWSVCGTSAVTTANHRLEAGATKN